MSFAFLILSLLIFGERSFYKNNVVLNNPRLNFEDLTTINGKIENLSLNAYNNELSSFNTVCNRCGLVFPNEVGSGTLKYFLFSESFYNDLTIYRTELYLKWEISNKDYYFLEKARLASITKHEKSSFYSINMFIFPSYITEYNHEGGFEYALLDEDNLTIEYIYLMGVGDISQIIFGEEKAPHKTLKDSDFPDDMINKGYYSIYVI